MNKVPGSGQAGPPAGKDVSQLSSAGSGPRSLADDLESGLTSRRDLKGVWRYLVIACAAAYALFYLYTAQFGLISVETHRGVYIGVAAFLIALVYPLRRGKYEQKVPIYDIAFALICAVSFGYFVVNFAEMQSRVGTPSPTDLVMGTLAVLCCLEITRRTTGWALPVVGIVVIAYSYFGPSMPGLLQHGGYSFERFINTQYMSLDGVFGDIVAVFANYVLLFIVFGTFLEKSGAAKFFVDLPYALASRLRGGPAKVAIMVSALMGSVNGSPVANVMTTGNFTIPLMKRSGFTSKFSGGVEAAASTGGQILPPVMGAGAFLIAEFTATPFSTIVLVSIIPALLYFVAVYFFIDFESLKEDIKGLRSDEDAGKLFLQGWFYLVPIVTVFWLVIDGRSPAFAAVWGCVLSVVVGFIPYKGKRGAGLRNVFDALWQSAVRSLDVAAIVGTIGIVVGVVGLTGLGLRMSQIVVDFSMGSLLLALILVAVASWIVGLGLTATSSYIMIAILVAPALTELGVSVLVAHLIIFWVSQDANLTPPICITAFAAAGLARAKPYATAWEAWKIGRGLYIVPLLMAYTPLVDGTWFERITVGVLGVLLVYLAAAGLSGYMRGPTNPVQRVLLIGSAIVMVNMSWVTVLIGIGIGGLVWVWQTVSLRRGSTMAETG